MTVLRTEERTLINDQDLLEQARQVVHSDLDADEYFAAVEQRAEELVDREASHPWCRRSRVARRAKASTPP
jgi:hypothetical protein